jgi:glycosyltransferase involved in cell wall biosynthesis
MAAVERRCLGVIDTTVALSEEDAFRLRAIAPQASVTVIAPPCNVAAFRMESADDDDADLRPPSSARGETTTSSVPLPNADSSDSVVEKADDALLLVGSFNWPPKRRNAEWLAREVFPIVRRHRPTATLSIVGSGADKLAPRLGNLSGVTLYANVPAVDHFYRKAAIAVIPEGQKSGMKLKALEAAGFGTAITSTTPGCEGTGFIDGQHCLIADNTAAFAAGVVRLINDAPLRRQLASSAQEHVRTFFSRERFSASIQRLLSESCVPTN